MGAPFWSNEEKQYFLQQIVPRSHYANGYYESTGRSFEDLAQVMQRDLDDRNLSRRTYNGDLLFQHWYQKVRPTIDNVDTSSITAPMTTAAVPQNNAQDTDNTEQAAASPNPSTDEGRVTDSELGPAENGDAPGCANSVSTGAASNAQDIEMGEIVETNSPSHDNTTNDTVAESRSGTELPLRGTGSAPAPRSTAPDQGTTSTKRSHSGKGPSSAPTKKAKRGKKPSNRFAPDSDTDDGEFDTTPRNPSTARPSTNPSHHISSMDANIARTHSGLPLKRFSPLVPANLDGDADPHRLRHPIPIPGGADPFTSPSRARDGPSTGIFSTTAGPSSYRIPLLNPGSSSSARRPAFSHDHGDVARLHHRVATGGGSSSSGPQQQGHTNQGHRRGGPGSGSGPARVHPVTGERLGEVVLQGPTLMTYCPSCQRPF